MVFGVGQFNDVIYIYPCCHGNEFWDKIGYNSAPVKDNGALFATTPPIFGPTLSDGVI